MIFPEYQNTEKMMKRYPDLHQKFAKWEKKLQKRSMLEHKFIAFVKKSEKISEEEAKLLTNCFLDDGNVNIMKYEMYSTN